MEHGRPAHVYYERWLKLIEEGPEAVMRMLCDTGEEGQALGSASPWVVLLEPSDRDLIVRQFQTWWRSRS